MDVSLFLGLPVDAHCAKNLESLDPLTRELYISKHQESYLCEVEFCGIKYLGKFIGEITTIVDLKLLEKNIYSIFRKIIPNYLCETIPLVVICIESPSI